MTYFIQNNNRTVFVFPLERDEEILLICIYKIQCNLNLDFINILFGEIKKITWLKNAPRKKTVIFFFIIIKDKVQ